MYSALKLFHVDVAKDFRFILLLLLLTDDDTLSRYFKLLWYHVFFLLNVPKQIFRTPDYSKKYFIIPDFESGKLCKTKSHFGYTTDVWITFEINECARAMILHEWNANTHFLAFTYFVITWLFIVIKWMPLSTVLKICLPLNSPASTHSPTKSTTHITNKIVKGNTRSFYRRWKSCWIFDIKHHKQFRIIFNIKNMQDFCHLLTCPCPLNNFCRPK